MDPWRSSSCSPDSSPSPTPQCARRRRHSFRHWRGIPANVTSSTIESLGIFGGPAIGGVLLAATSPDVVFAAAAASFLLAAFLVSRVRVDVPPERAERRGGG